MTAANTPYAQSAATEPSHHQPLMTIPQFCERFPWPSQSALRAYVFRASELGIERAFVRLGRRVLVDPQQFFACIRELDAAKATQEDSLYAPWK